MTNEKLLVFFVLVASVPIVYGGWYPARPPIHRWISEAVRDYHVQHSRDSEGKIGSQNGIRDGPQYVDIVGNTVDLPKYESHQRRSVYRDQLVGKHHQQVQHSRDSKNKVGRQNGIPDDVQIVDIKGNTIDEPKYEYEVRPTQDTTEIEFVDLDGNRVSMGNEYYLIQD